MTGQAIQTIGEVVDLWRATFGEPPASLIEPAQMMALLEAHAAPTTASSMRGAQETRVLRSPLSSSGLVTRLCAEPGNKALLTARDLTHAHPGVVEPTWIGLSRFPVRNRVSRRRVWSAL
jgi:hypothetical protein